MTNIKQLIPRPSQWRKGLDGLLDEMVWGISDERRRNAIRYMAELKYRDAIPFLEIYLEEQKSLPIQDFILISLLTQSIEALKALPKTQE